MIKKKEIIEAGQTLLKKNQIKMKLNIKVNYHIRHG